MFEGVPILDYAPSTLLGICVLLILFGRLVPYRAVKQILDENQFLRSTNTKQAEALEEAQALSKVVRHLLGDLHRGADQ